MLSNSQSWNKNLERVLGNLLPNYENLLYIVNMELILMIIPQIN